MSGPGGRGRAGSGSSRAAGAAPVARRPRFARPGGGGLVALSGFSLLELLVAVSVLAMLLLMLIQLADVARGTFADVRARSSRFEEARQAFDIVTRRLGQAVLNPYWTYDDPGHPTTYVRQSELHFICGPAGELVGDSAPGGRGRRTGHAVFFQAPFGYVGQGRRADRFSGLETLVNSWGYFVEFRGDALERPPFLDGRPGLRERHRFRLVEFRPAAQSNRIFAEDLKSRSDRRPAAYREWFATARQGGVNAGANYREGPAESGRREMTTRVVADNVVALIVSPRVSAGDRVAGGGRPVTFIAPDFAYDSRRWQWQSGGNPLGGDERARLTMNELPPLVDIVLIAIDEASAERLDTLGFGGERMPPLVPDGLFRRAEQLDDDLRRLEDRLSGVDGVLGLRVDHEVFRTTVQMRASKWSDYRGGGVAP